MILALFFFSFRPFSFFAFGAFLDFRVLFAFGAFFFFTFDTSFDVPSLAGALFLVAFVASTSAENTF